MRKKQNYRLGILALLITMYWTGCYAIEYGIVSVPYTIQEIYGAGEVAIILMLFIGVLSLFTEKEAAGKKILAGSILFALIFLHVGGIVYWANGYTRTGLIAIMDKKVSGQDYYFFVENEEELMRVKCSKEIFDDLIVDSEVLYTMELKGNHLSSDRARLQKIDLTDYIDNRR